MDGNAQLMYTKPGYLKKGLHHIGFMHFRFSVPKYLFQKSLKHDTFINTHVKQNFHVSAESLAVISLGNIKNILDSKGNEYF